VSKKILVVDDESTMRNACKLVIETIMGHPVTTANDGQQALTVLETETFDLVITDYQMPKMPGPALLKAMRSQGINTPVIIMSGAINGDDVPGLLDQGFVKVLIKPFENKDLEKAVKEALAL